MTRELVVRQFLDRDLPAVLDLLRRSLGESADRPRTPSWFDWKHFRNPFGRSIMLVAEKDERIVGLRALLRWELLRPDGGRLLCARPVDTATDPDFRRHGVFRELTMAAIEEAKGQELHLLFNTPNPRSGAGYLSMGWRVVGSVGMMLRPKWGLLRSRRHEDGDLVGAAPQLEPVSDLQVNDRTARGLRTPRTPDYLRWRFGDNPIARYLTAAFSGAQVVVRPNLRSRRRELVVSEIFGGAGRLLAGIVRSSSVDYSVAWFSRRAPERAEALRAGLVPVPWKRTLTLMARPLTKLDIDVHAFSNWDLALGDLELL